jgi:hypothetical protein
MRKDFPKILVHTSRWGGKKNSDVLSVRRSPIDLDSDGEEFSHDPGRTPARGKVGMRQKRHGKHPRKEFGENLRPLYRFLDGQVGRPWDAVYSEIREVCTPRGTVGNHIYQHLWDAVVRDCEIGPDGQVWEKGASGPLTSYGGRDGWKSLYIHPETGLLCRTPKQKLQRWGKGPLAQDEVRTEDFVWLKKKNKIWVLRRDSSVGQKDWFEVSLVPSNVLSVTKDSLMESLQAFGIGAAAASLATQALVARAPSRNWYSWEGSGIKFVGPVPSSQVLSP